MKASKCFKMLPAALAVIFMMAQGAWASTAAEIAEYITTATGGYLGTVANDDTVTVTGTRTGIAATLNLDIDEGVIVVWQATLTGTGPTNTRGPLISINSGSGEFRAESGTIQNTSSNGGAAIWNSSASVITVSGSAIISSRDYYDGTIYLYDSDAATTDRLIITGGTVRNTNTNSKYADAIHNRSAGGVRVSGGLVRAESANAIFSGGGAVNVSGGTVDAYASPSTSSYKGIAIYNGGGTVTVSGGTVKATTGTAIYDSIGVVNISDGTVSATTGTAIYIYSFRGTVNISGGTVSATTGQAINSWGTVNVSGTANITSANTSTSDGTIGIIRETLNVSGGTVKNTAAGAGVNAIYNSQGTVTITGGTISTTAASGNACRHVASASSSTLILGGSPIITGKILSSYPEKLSVLTFGDDIFDPGQQVYTLDFLAAQYGSGNIAVTGGSGFRENFILYNADWLLTSSEADLVMVWPLKVSFDLNSDLINEDFEGSEHSFTIENGSQTNKWAVGTAAAAGGSKSAYISNNGGTSNAYTTTSKSVVHIYRDVTIPASSDEYILKFKWRAVGERSSPTDLFRDIYDYLDVYLIETSVTPTAGMVFDEGAGFLGRYLDSSSWQQATVKIRASNYGTTKRLVFMWYNDEAVGTQPPAAIDNIVLAPAAPASVNVVPGGTVSAARKPSPSDFTRPGYVNDGKWYIDPAGTTEFVFGDGGTAVQEDMTLYLKWLPSSGAAYTVTFKDWDGAVLKTQTVNEGTAATAPTAPTRAGYNFTGWDKTFGNITGDLVVTAQYEEVVTPPQTYAVTFSAGGNGALTAAVDGSAVTTGAEVEHGKSVVFTAAPDAGYGVSGWTLNGAAVADNTSTTYTLAGVSAASAVSVSFGKSTSVSVADRVIPPQPNEEATVIAPMVILAGEFTAGPNPVSRSSGAVNFYRQGRRASNSELRIYDATGNVVNKVKITDNALNNQSRCVVGSWDLTDKKGRQVSEGTYLVKGAIKTPDGKSEKVSVIIGVR